MRTYEEYRVKALSLVATRRQRAFARLNARIAQIYVEHPELKELENEREKLSQNVAREVSLGFGAGGNAGKHLAAANKAIEEHYRSAGVDEKDFEPSFRCTICDDTGRHKGYACDCVKQLINELLRKDLEEMTPLSLSDFSTFDLSYYPDAYDPEFGRSVREHMQSVYSYCRDFAEHFAVDNRSILMVGDAGLGKTHLALAIANEVLKQGYTTVYVSAGNIFFELEAERRAGGRHLLDFLSSAELLIFDDLGSELVNPSLITMLYNLVSTRMNSKKCTVYTTNITTQELLTMRYTEKIASRLLGSCDQLHFAGSDIRISKNANE